MQVFEKPVQAKIFLFAVTSFPARLKGVSPQSTPLKTPAALAINQIIEYIKGFDKWN